MSLARLGSAAAVIVCLLLIGCGDDEETVTETTPAATGAETTETQATEETTGGEEATTTRSVKEIAPGKHGPKYFETPSQNIGCYVASSAARCDIKVRDWEPPEIPKACIKAGVDFGQGIAVGKKGASFVCAGDTAFGGEATLGYGQVSQRGIFRCKSAESGMTCSNIENGAGFFLSRERYRIF